MVDYLHELFADFKVDLFRFVGIQSKLFHESLSPSSKMVDLLISVKQAEGVEGLFDWRWFLDALLAISACAHEAAGHRLAQIEILSEEGVVVAAIVFLNWAFTDVF